MGRRPTHRLRTESAVPTTKATAAPPPHPEELTTLYLRCPYFLREFLDQQAAALDIPLAEYIRRLFLEKYTRVTLEGEGTDGH